MVDRHKAYIMSEDVGFSAVDEFDKESEPMAHAKQKELAPKGRMKVDNLLGQYNEAISIFDDRVIKADNLIAESSTGEQKQYWGDIKDKAIKAKLNALEALRNFYKHIGK